MIAHVIAALALGGLFILFGMFVNTAEHHCGSDGGCDGCTSCGSKETTHV